MKKIEKGKLVFASVIVLVLFFMGAYMVLFLNKEETPLLESNQIPVPKLADEHKEYDSKLEALDDLKEVEQRNAPSIYDERLLDSSGVYDPYLLEKEKKRVVDSIYRLGRIDYSARGYRRAVSKKITGNGLVKKDSHRIDLQTEQRKLMDASVFFHSAPELERSKDTVMAMVAIEAVVNGRQVVKKDFRLEMQLTTAAWIEGRYFPKNTLLYGFVSFKPNRTLLKISHINQYAVSLKAFDFQDGSEGIYILNNFQATAGAALVDDAIGEINVPSIPQVGVLKKVFRRSNKHVKVTISNNYRLLLKSSR